jgi:hypothetical protein
MAFNSANLSALVHANGFTLFHYKTTDTDTVVSTSGYFNNAAGQMRVGDIVHLATATGGTPIYGQTVVLSNTGTVVDVADITVISSVDTE